MTDATPLASEQITQEDREAAVTLVPFCFGASDLWKANVLAGYYDDGEVVQAFARHRIAALSASPAPSGQGVSVPEGMRAWHGGKSAPDDWDGGEVLLNNGERGDGNVWDHHPSRDTRIIAYTPKPAPAPSCAPGKEWQDMASAPFDKHVLVDCARVEAVVEAIQYRHTGWHTFGPNGAYRCAPLAWCEKPTRSAALSPQGLDAKEGGE